jgi:hypothetical protein
VPAVVVRGVGAGVGAGCPGTAGTVMVNNRIKPGPSVVRSLALSQRPLSCPGLTNSCPTRPSRQTHPHFLRCSTQYTQLHSFTHSRFPLSQHCVAASHGQHSTRLHSPLAAVATAIHSTSLGRSNTRSSPGRHAVLPSPPRLHEPLIQTLGRTLPSPLGLDTCKRHRSHCSATIVPYHGQTLSCCAAFSVPVLVPVPVDVSLPHPAATSLHNTLTYERALFCLL